MSSLFYPITIPVVALAPPHETPTVPVPGVVRVPINHVHNAWPCASAFRGTSPAATLSVPSGVTYAIEHTAPGVVCIETLAVWPGRPPTTERNLTPTAVAVGMAVGIGVGDGGTAVGGGTGVAVDERGITVGEIGVLVVDMTVAVGGGGVGATTTGVGDGTGVTIMTGIGV